MFRQIQEPRELLLRNKRSRDTLFQVVLNLAEGCQ